MWYNTIEFYVIAGAIAASAVVAASVPQRRGKAELHFASGELFKTDDAGEMPRIFVEVDKSGCVAIRREGLRGVRSGGAVSLAVNVIGFDVMIEERITPGGGEEAYDGSIFKLDFLAPERYHIKYNSEDAGVFAAFTLNVMPGIRLQKELK